MRTVQKTPWIMLLIVCCVLSGGCGITRSPGYHVRIKGQIILPPTVDPQTVKATLYYPTPRIHTTNAFRDLSNAWGPGYDDGGLLGRSRYQIHQTLKPEGREISLDLWAEVYRRKGVVVLIRGKGMPSTHFAFHLDDQTTPGSRLAPTRFTNFRIELFADAPRGETQYRYKYFVMPNPMGDSVTAGQALVRLQRSE